MWPRAERYRIVQGTIYADGERLAEDDRPYDKNGNPRKYKNYARRRPSKRPSAVPVLCQVGESQRPFGNQRISRMGA